MYGLCSWINSGFCFTTSNLHNCTSVIDTIETLILLGNQKSQVYPWTGMTPFPSQDFHIS